MNISINELITVSFTLFAVIDIVGSVPLLISLKEKMGGIRSIQATLISGALMILFLYAGEPFLRILGLDIHSFAVGGSVVIFLLGLEMVFGSRNIQGRSGCQIWFAGTHCIPHHCRKRNPYNHHVAES